MSEENVIVYGSLFNRFDIFKETITLLCPDLTDEKITELWNWKPLPRKHLDFMSDLIFPVVNTSREDGKYFYFGEDKCVKKIIWVKKESG